MDDIFLIIDKYKFIQIIQKLIWIILSIDANRGLITFEVFKINADFGEGFVQGAEGEVWFKSKSTYIRENHCCQWGHLPRRFGSSRLRLGTRDDPPS